MVVDGTTLVLEYVCPSVGVVLATQMFLAPFADVQGAIRSGSLGELNPLPWVFMLGNCTGWVLYSYLTRVRSIRFSFAFVLPDLCWTLCLWSLTNRVVFFLPCLFVCLLAFCCSL
jgi:solute carrier family 50 protein (sugar transporter)